MAAALHTGSNPPPSSASRRTHGDTVRVVIIDDSLTVRTVYSRMIDQADGFAIVAKEASAEKGIAALARIEADVVLLDLEMPGMGGLEALPKILAANEGIQVLVVSSLTDEGAEATLSALSMGAADTMLKPRPGDFNDEYRATLLAKIRALSGKADGDTDESIAPVAPLLAADRKKPQIIAIGASTGGIHALNLFLRRLPQSFDLPILITQHLPSSFMSVFTRQMEMAAGREAIIADEGVEILPGRVIIAPGHGHMTVRRAGGRHVTGLSYDPVKSGCTPSVDPMFTTIAEAYDGHAAGILLSGMGRDGTDGATALARAGGSIYAQDEASCAVWGMPRTVSETGIAIATLPPQELADELVASLGGPS